LFLCNENGPRPAKAGLRNVFLCIKPSLHLPMSANLKKEPIDILQGILTKALEAKASDIHFEPDAKNLNVRFRIDGMLTLMETLDKSFHEPFVGTLKVVAQMDIANKRIPQDGAYHIVAGDHKINFRISTYPTVHGEAVVMRILNKANALMSLKELGFDQTQLEQMTNIVKTPYGMLLITGPTGSGKTSFLYAVLNELRKPSVNIVSIEDPVEFLLDGVRQTNVSDYGELTFARAIKGTLRQDPDIIMVGEIRDAETAETAFQAALSGRFVISTFHTFSLSSIISRLMEMGIPQSIVTTSLIGVVSSRLVRTICPNCKKPYELSAHEKSFFNEIHNDVIFYKGTGCDKCRNTGYLGRTGLFNVVPFDDEIKKFAVEYHTEKELLDIYKKKNIKTLQESAMDKVLQGDTTVEEVARVLGALSSLRKIDETSTLL
jgi:type II secretory ATPase GspE/PulE/Tfp pilus assembly ATPase PilB-like protein